MARQPTRAKRDAQIDTIPEQGTAKTIVVEEDGTQSQPLADSASAGPAENPMVKAEAIKAAMSRVVGRLDILATKQVGMKQQLEDRWLRNLRSYYGRYEPHLEARLEKEKRSRVYVKATRSKTMAWESRLLDLLFPTDDENWDIQPTPDPELIETMAASRSQAQIMLRDANTVRDSNPGQAQQIAMQAQQGPGADYMKAKATSDAAKKASAKMRKVIADQLAEAYYNIKARDFIHFLCLMGTGIMKGPVTSGKMRKKWRNSGSDTGWLMDFDPDPRPDCYMVSPWHYFPDMTATSPLDKDFEFERFLDTEGSMRKLAQRPGYDKAAIRDLLEFGSRESVPDFVSRMRTITGIDEGLDARYIRWGYCGPLETDEVEDLLKGMYASEDPAMKARAQQLVDLVEVDPLYDQTFMLEFCQGKMLKFGIHPLDSGDSLYSVMPFDRDESSIFGLGIPELMESSQNAINAAWRMILDNAALSVGPQIVVDKKAIVPENGSWEITSRKVWLMTSSNLAGAPAVFQLHNIQNNQAELMNIIEMALRFVDDESMMPTIAEGESGAQETKTKGGLTLLMNAANVGFRRVVRNFDDFLTTPFITRYYDWNMQHNKDPDIKGDMETVARGSSVLLVREIQAPNLMAITTNWGTNPVLQPLLKVAEAARKTVSALMIQPDEILKTDEELAEDDQRRQQQPPQVPLEIQIEQLRGQNAMELAKYERQTILMQEDMRRNTAMQTGALKATSESSLQTQDIGHKERTTAVEAALASSLPADKAQTVSGSPS